MHRVSIPDIPFLSMSRQAWRLYDENIDISDPQSRKASLALPFYPHSLYANPYLWRLTTTHMDKKPQWFETWFDSPYYPILYRNRNIEEAQLFIENLITLLHPPAGAKALDMACGRGRHAHFLAQKGLEVVGIDISPKSIQTAQLRYQMPNLEFYVHDMRLPYRINYFDYIFNFFTSIGYFNQLSENRQVFNAVHKGLKPHGKLMVDFMNVDKVMSHIVKREEKTIDGIHFYIRREVEDNKILKHIKVDDGNKTALFTESVQILKPHHFHHFLNEEGFRILKEFGDYHLNPFDSTKSDRYIFIAEKLA